MLINLVGLSINITVTIIKRFEIALTGSMMGMAWKDFIFRA